MLYIAITIALNIVLAVLFKQFPKWGIDAMQAIVANYFICILTGSLFIGQVPYSAVVLHEPWLPWALGMGTGFISLFNLIAYSTKVDGITTTTIANKLSLAIPITFALFFMGETAGIMKATGLLLTIPAILLTAYTKEAKTHHLSLLPPLALFVGSGILDTLMNYVQHNMLTGPGSQALFAIYCFSSAAAVGVLLMGWRVMRGNITFSIKNLLAGVAIGIPNYFSIYFLIRSLNNSGYPSTVTFPVLNVGILVASTLTAVIFFKEKMSGMRIIGLVLSLAAILCITMAG
jgi:drug/metabolite transporter (DMT)-like permease